MANRPADEIEPEDPNEGAEEAEDDGVADDELIELEAVSDDDDDDDDDSDESEDSEDADDSGASAASGGGEDSDEASLEDLMAKRSTRRGSEEPVEDILALVSENQEPIAEPLPIRARPIKDRQEFVCNRCHLVKPRVQLADEKRGLCRDCV